LAATALASLEQLRGGPSGLSPVRPYPRAAEGAFDEASRREMLRVAAHESGHAIASLLVDHEAKVALKITRDASGRLRFYGLTTERAKSLVRRAADTASLCTQLTPSSPERARREHRQPESVDIRKSLPRLLENTIRK
jgi:hypothetical protein